MDEKTVGVVDVVGLIKSLTPIISPYISLHMIITNEYTTILSNISTILLRLIDYNEKQFWNMMMAECSRIVFVR